MSAHLITQRSQGPVQDLNTVNVGGSGLLASSERTTHSLGQEIPNG